MARQNLFSRALHAVTGRLSADTVRQRLEDAEIAVSEAEYEWRLAALETEAGGDPAAEAAAEGALTKARHEVSRQRAVLLEVETRNAEEARAAQVAREIAEDAEVAKACDALAKAAQTLAGQVPAYAKAHAALLGADQRLRALATTNSRVRQDLLYQNVDTLIALELTRIGGSTPPPGFDRMAATSRDARDIRPIAEHFDDLASAIKGGLRYV